jgi:hypothetical protein
MAATGRVVSRDTLSSRRAAPSPKRAPRAARPSASAATGCSWTRPRATVPRRGAPPKSGTRTDTLTHGPIPISPRGKDPLRMSAPSSRMASDRAPGFARSAIRASASTCPTSRIMVCGAAPGAVAARSRSSAARAVSISARLGGGLSGTIGSGSTSRTVARATIAIAESARPETIRKIQRMRPRPVVQRPVSRRSGERAPPARG